MKEMLDIFQKKTAQTGLVDLFSRVVAAQSIK